MAITSYSPVKMADILVGVHRPKMKKVVAPYVGINHVVSFRGVSNLIRHRTAESELKKFLNKPANAKIKNIIHKSSYRPTVLDKLSSYASSTANKLTNPTHVGEYKRLISYVIK